MPDWVQTILAKKGLNPDQPRVPAGSPTGGQWTSGGDVIGNQPRRLRDGLVRQPMSAEKMLADHPTWGMDRCAAYADRLNRETKDPNAIEIVSHGSDGFAKTCARARQRIRAVHDEVGGYSAIAVPLSRLEELRGYKVLGYYNHGNILMPPSGSQTTFIHEYGHHIDHLLGSNWGGKMFSTMPDNDDLFPANWDKGDRREIFADFYESWVGAGGNVGKAMGSLQWASNRFSPTDRWPEMVRRWDAVLRDNLRMKK